MTTWVRVARGGEFAGMAFGYGVFGGGGGDWSAVSKDSADWVQQVRSGTVEAQFELNEPLGGPEWTAVDKDE